MAEINFGDVGAGLGSTLGAIASLAGLGGEGGEDYYRRALKVWRKLKEPDFDFSELTAPELRIVAESMPEVYNALVPEEVKLAKDSPELRAAQMQGLAKIEGYSRTGLGRAEELAAQDASQQMSREYSRGTESVLQNLGARGRLGAGDEIQARLIANQGASNLARGLGSDLMRERIDARQRAAYALPGVAGSIRAQDTELQKYNAEAQNRHNELISKMRTDAARYAAAARQHAQDQNVARAQDTANQNVQMDYLNRLENLNRRNDLEGRLFDARVTKAAGESGALTARGKQEDQQKGERDKNIMTIGESIGRFGGGVWGLT